MTESIRGKDLKAGDVLKLWCAPTGIRVVRLREYTGTFAGKPGFEGAQIATFDNAQEMTILADDVYERVVDETAPQRRWHVYFRSQRICTVYFPADKPAKEVKRILIERDEYHPEIGVVDAPEKE